MKKCGAACVIVLATSLAFGCAERSTDRHSDEAPEVSSESLHPTDWASSWGSWSIAPFGETTFVINGDTGDYSSGTSWGISFTDSSSSGQTRGGGACMVQHVGGSCNADPDCGTPPAGQYNYCFQNTCYNRPGSQAAYCTAGPDRYPGFYPGATTWPLTHVLGCMTKAAGPSTACGGTDASSYVRTVVPITLRTCTYGSSYFYCY